MTWWQWFLVALTFVGVFSLSYWLLSSRWLRPDNPATRATGDSTKRRGARRWL